MDETLSLSRIIRMIEDGDELGEVVIDNLYRIGRVIACLEAFSKIGKDK
tara:strand:- start:424 stop:570 length:147 start_codon:yes stop_codon:yes gene_type:complete